MESLAGASRQSLTCMNAGAVRPAPAGSSPRGHIPCLAGIRASAVLLVLLAHSDLTKEYTGGTGVSIFFFLSGYLITTLLEREFAATGTISVRSFYIRRFFRIFPPLYLMIAVGCIATSTGLTSGTVTPHAVLAAAGFWGNYFMLDPHHTWPDGFGVLWSLAVEEHFYLVFPLLYLAISRWSLRGKVTLLSILCGVALLWRLTLVFAWHQDKRLYLATDTRFDAILIGCILALVYPSLRAANPRLFTSRGAAWVTALSIVGVLLWEHVPPIKGPLAYTLTSASLLPIFAYILANPKKPSVRWLDNRILARIGVLSYSVYLFHMMCNSAVAHRTHLSRPLSALLAIPLYLLIALAIERFVDKPSHRLRQRLLKRLARTAADDLHPQGDRWGGVAQPSPAAAKR
jgi:peptidoglycan/LPS O-acetylase OafA/YrhL